MGANASVCAANNNSNHNNDNDIDTVQHDPPSKLLVDTILPATSHHPYHLNIRTNIAAQKEAAIMSDSAPFPFQVEGTNDTGLNILYLRDLTNHQVVGIIKQDDTNEQLFYVLAFQPAFEGQPPVHRDKYSNKQLYEWVQVQQHFDLFHVQTRYSMTTAHHNAASYEAQPLCSLSHHSFRVVKNGKVCATITGKESSDHWKLAIAAGVDPCLLICFAAVFDKIVIRHWKTKMEMCNEI